MHPFNLNEFTFINGVLSAEASTIGFSPRERMIAVRSHITGVEVRFRYHSVERDREGDILWWCYVPVNPADAPSVMAITIFND